MKAMTNEELLDWGDGEIEARKADLEAVKSQADLEAIQKRAKLRRRMVGLSASQAAAAISGARTRQRWG